MKDARGGFLIVGLMCLGVFVCMLDTTIMNIALPAIETGLHVSLQTTSWMLNVYTMSIAIFSIPLSCMADLYGKARFFVFGMLVFGIGSALCGSATSGDFLIASRFVQSIGASILMPVSMIIGVSAVSIQKRPFALAILGSTQGLAAALGPTIGGSLTQALGWSWVFYVNLPVCAMAIAFGLAKLPWRTDHRIAAKIDIPGLITSGLCIFSLTLVLIKAPDWGWSSDISWICYGVALASFASFVVVERAVSQPMVNLKLFRHRHFVAGTLSMFMATLYMVAVTVLLPQFLTHFQSKTELAAAILVTPVSGAIFFVAPVSATIARKLGNVLPIFFGFLFLSLSYYLLRNLSVNSSDWFVVLSCAPLGAGYGLIIGPSSSASAGDFEGEMLTSAQSVTQMFRQISVVLAVSISISGLTHYLSAQQSEVSRYASEQVNALSVPSTVKATILAESKKELSSSSWSSGETQAPSKYAMSDHDRTALIHQQVDAQLAKLPKSARSAARPQITAAVTRQVDDRITVTEAKVQAYSKNLTTYATNAMSKSFSDLYRFGLPLVLMTSVLSLLFLRYRRRGAPVPEVQMSGD